WYFCFLSPPVHAPAGGPPVIQEPSRAGPTASGMLDRPVEPGDDREIGCLKFESEEAQRSRESHHLAPLAGRGRIASKDAIRVRGTHRELGAWRVPLTIADASHRRSFLLGTAAGGRLRLSPHASRACPTCAKKCATGVYPGRDGEREQKNHHAAFPRPASRCFSRGSTSCFRRRSELYQASLLCL